MTNQEKAEELLYGYGQCCKDECMYIALKMAEWKDQQFKKYLEKKKDKWFNAYQVTRDSDYYAVYNTLDEIIDELFKED